MYDDYIAVLIVIVKIHFGQHRVKDLKKTVFSVIWVSFAQGFGHGQNKNNERKNISDETKVV